MTDVDMLRLWRFADEAVSRLPVPDRQDARSEVLIALIEFVQAEPGASCDDVTRTACRRAATLRKRAQRHTLRTAALDGAAAGTHVDQVIDAAATSILLEAAIEGAITGANRNIANALRRIL